VKRPEKILVLMGGPSPEAEVSRKTALAVCRALSERGYKTDLEELSPATLRRICEDPPEFVFPALHGWGGEDGRIQGLLDLLQVPYAGSGVLASALAMDKGRCRAFLGKRVHHPRFVVMAGSLLSPDEIPFPPPWVVKPSGAGSSLGVSIVEDPVDFRRAVEEALRFDRTILIEERVIGRELSVGVVWGEPLGIVEILPQDRFYSYSAKYSGTSKYIINPDLSPSLRSELFRNAVSAYEALGCRGCIRVDFIVKEETPYFLEVNTIPGMTEHSLIPKMGAYRGISFAELIEWIAFQEARPRSGKEVWE